MKLQAAPRSRCNRTEGTVARCIELKNRFFWGWRACVYGEGERLGVQRGWCNPSSLAAWKQCVVSSGYQLVVLVIVSRSLPKDAWSPDCLDCIHQASNVLRNQHPPISVDWPSYTFAHWTGTTHRYLGLSMNVSLFE
jgi:hypothetical protein